MTEVVIQYLQSAINESFSQADQWTIKEESYLNYQPEKGWSPIQVLEHITLTNHLLLILIEKAVRKSLAQYPEGVEPITVADLTRLDAVADPNAFSWIRPEHMEPKGMALTDIQAKFAEQKRQFHEKIILFTRPVLFLSHCGYFQFA